MLSKADFAHSLSGSQQVSSAAAYDAVRAWDATGHVDAAADGGPLRQALVQCRRRVTDLEAEVARLRRRCEEQSRNAGSCSSSNDGSSGGRSRDLLLEGLLASSDSDVASQVMSPLHEVARGRCLLMAAAYP